MTSPRKVDIVKVVTTRLGKRLWDHDWYKLTLTIGSLGQIPPAEGHECEGYLARINSNEKVKNSGITVVCEQSPSGVQVKLEHKPDTISNEDANQLISEAMFNQVLGDWVFTVEKSLAT